MSVKTDVLLFIIGRHAANDTRTAASIANRPCVIQNRLYFNCFLFSEHMTLSYISPSSPHGPGLPPFQPRQQGQLPEFPSVPVQTLHGREGQRSGFVYGFRSVITTVSLSFYRPLGRCSPNKLLQRTLHRVPVLHRA